MSVGTDESWMFKPLATHGRSRRQPHQSAMFERADHRRRSSENTRRHSRRSGEIGPLVRYIAAPVPVCLVTDAVRMCVTALSLCGLSPRVSVSVMQENWLKLYIR